MKRGRRAGRCYAIVETLTAKQISFGASTLFQNQQVYISGTRIRQRKYRATGSARSGESHVRDNSEPQFSLWLGIHLTVLAMALQ